jgi:hypothetical protein
MQVPATKSIISIVLLGCFSSVAVAQAPAAGGTLWHFLGIPQGARYLRDNTLNRSGNRPALERKPPLKPIGDPKNLESPDASIKKAAEVKQAEDLKKQKIKAVKYLASIGCGCYNRDGSITDALLKSMDDCTEEVRLATVQAMSEAAMGERCANCKQRSCCSEELSNKLYEIAYERDETGCFLEPSERVRLAAAEALRTCCESRDDMFMMEMQPTPAAPSGGEVPGVAPEVGGERPGNLQPSPSDALPPAAIPLQDPRPITVPAIPVPVPVAPPPPAALRPSTPAPFAPSAKSTTPATEIQSSRRTAMLKSQPVQAGAHSENTFAMKPPAPPIPQPVVARTASLPIRVNPHWQPGQEGQSVFFTASASSPMPIDAVTAKPSPRSVVVASLPDREPAALSQPATIDETLGLAPIVTRATMTRLPAVEGTSQDQDTGAPIVKPASMRRPQPTDASQNQASDHAPAPVLTTNESKPATRKHAKSTVPQQLPGAQFGTGWVTSIRVKDGTAVIEFENDSVVPTGSVLRAYHEYALTGKRAVCDLQVVESDSGLVVAVANGRSSLTDLAVGDRTVVLQ